MGCGNFVSVFSEDPQDMPGQGLARTDNYRGTTADSEYNQLIRSYLAGLQPALDAEQEFGPKFSAARLKSLDTTLSGNSETAGVSKLYLDALRASDPEAAALLDSLTQTATSELALDNQLDPNQTRLVEQSSRASAAARGLGFGPGDAFNETLAKVGYGDQLRDKRRGNALTLAQLRLALAKSPADIATGASMGSDPSIINSDKMFNVLNNVYAQNQQNNRVQSGLETQVGMHQADIWNNWLKTGVAAMAGGGSAGGGVSFGGGGGGGMSSI